MRYLWYPIFLLAWLLSSSAYALDDSSLAVAAAQYLQSMRDNHDPAGQSIPTLLQQAEQQTQKKNWADAIARYEAAIVAGAGQTATWLVLSQVWQTQAQQQKERNEHYPVQQRSRERMQQSAWNALQTARAPLERARALFRLGDLYDRGQESKKAIAAYREALDLEDNPRIAKRYQVLMDANAFQIKGVSVESDSATPKVCLNFSDDLAKGRALHYEDYLVIEPAIQPVVTPEEQQLCVEGVSHGQSYTIKARAGIPAAGGEKTLVSQEFTAKIEDRKPTLGFRGATYVLPKTGSQQLPLTSVNLQEVRLRVLRINDRNLLREIERDRITNLLDGYDLNSIAKNSGEQIWEGVLTLASGERNQEVTTALPISEILHDPQPGVYIVAAQSVKADPDNHWENQATQWLVVSDLGLFTMRGNDGLHVFVRSLSSAQPLSGIDLRLYARNNGELGAATTDRQGYARLDPGLLRGEGGREPAALMAFGSGDYNFLDLTHPAFDLSDRGVEGRAAPGAVDAFLYTERGVYRPGETVELMTLIRDSRGYALPEAPLTLKVFRPDEVESAQLRPGHPALGGYHTPIPMSLNARTGTWTVKAYLDPKGEPIGQISFQVEDFVPQRLKLELSSAAPVLKPGEPAVVDIDGRFLYGAPAANLKAEGELVLREDANPYPAFPGYRFGLTQDSWTAQRFPVVLAGTDDQGKAQAQISLSETPDTTRPLLARVRVSLFEPGGRPVTRSLDLPYRVQPFAIGIKPRFGDGGVKIGQEAAFELIALDSQGQAQAQSGLSAKLVREEYRYYWYYDEGRWNYKLIIRDSASVASQTLNIVADQPAVLTQRGLDWGRYRLDVLDAKTGVASSVRFNVGWFESPGVNDTPDQMKVTLDQPRYPAGATAKIFLRAPFAGEVLLNVVGDRLWLSKTVSIPADGATVELPIPAEWGPGVYIAATAFRVPTKTGTAAEAASSTTTRGPGRAIGVAWVGLDPAPRTLNITLDAPTEWKPRQTVELPVTVTGLDSGQSAYLTVAAVDEGILQLTDFTAPDPVDYFLGKRRLGMQLLDLYGKLIETGGRPGALKVGGDAEARQLDPSAIRTVKTLALFSGPVALDANGQAKIPLVLPDFNGQVRLMAVAWDRNRLGRAEMAPLVRDPLVARVYLPRFLAPEDQSQISVTVQNLSAPPGDYAIRLSAAGAVAVNEPAAFTFSVADSAIQSRESRTFTLRGLQPGAGKLQLHVQGPNGFNLVRESDIGVRPAQNLVTERTVQRLNPGENLRLNNELLAGYLPGTGRVRLSVASRPNLNVPELLAQLDRYPYGCLEQTTSRALPLIYFNEVAEIWAGQKATEAGLRERVQEAIQRILTLQDAGGGFGLWGPDSSVEDWLSAYAMDFLVRARQAKYLVPDSAWRRGLAHLQERLRTDDFADKELGWRAYQLDVLAREQKAAIGDLRYLHDNYLLKMPSALAQAQLGSALARYGELERAKEAFTAALNRTTDRTIGVRDYGSPLRDRAALLALLAEAKLLPERVPQLAEEVAADFNQRRYTSTQEQAWLLLAAYALSQQTGALRLAVDEQATTADPFYLKPVAEQLVRGVAVANQGEHPAWSVLDRSGVPTAEQPSAREGFTITRRYYTRSGQEIDPGQIRQNDLLVAVITGEVQGSEEQQALVVDLLPAGLEIENARLGHGASTLDIAWLPKLTETLHTEIRDDRFVAALDIDRGGERAFTLAYLARAVTPGVYRQPAIYVEDMYKPWQFGRGAMGMVKVE
ncbi:MAG: alpha-2-macroglobulin family protein [Gammaproteobacteria bacterium]|nr:alpha-2-macroglobulin family protein [Gammaproteobacteria bacterium]MCP5195955.1 alpha-2-macroglobulin family protein [Gammaproteobacteria bacterium]